MVLAANETFAVRLGTNWIASRAASVHEYLDRDLIESRRSGSTRSSEPVNPFA
jgi:hypothetical protein